MEMVYVTGIETSRSWTARVQRENLEELVRERERVVAGMEEEVEAHNMMASVLELVAT